MSAAAFEGWAIVELLGHRRIAGHVSEVELFGSKMCRVDVPGANGDPLATQFYVGGAIYCLTPTTEDVARRVAISNRPGPVALWELPALPERTDRSSNYEHVDDDAHEDDQEE